MSNSYGEAKYWDERYTREGQGVVFDWYQAYNALKPVVTNYCKKPSKVLMLGCGNAAISEDMVLDGYEEIWNIDISSVLINTLQSRNKHPQQLRYMVMDALHLEFESASFDAIIDKGTLDAILCGDNSVQNCHELLSEACRVLKPGGVYLLITYGDPRSRLRHLEAREFDWTVTLHIIPRPGGDFPLCEGKPVEDNPKYLLHPVTVDVDGRTLRPSGTSIDSGNVHYIYACTKRDRAEPVVV